MASTRDRSARARQFRAEMRAMWMQVNAACGICGQATIDWDGVANAPDSFELHHLKDPENYPELEFEPSNTQPSHSRCNRSRGRNSEMALTGETSEEW